MTTINDHHDGYAKRRNLAVNTNKPRADLLL